ERQQQAVPVRELPHRALLRVLDLHLLREMRRFRLPPEATHLQRLVVGPPRAGRLLRRAFGTTSIVLTWSSSQLGTRFFPGEARERGGGCRPVCNPALCRPRQRRRERAATGSTLPRSASTNDFFEEPELRDGFQRVSRSLAELDAVL
ncbi:unnamed protein product, partial [Prorocentrum cordatum]